MQPSSLVCMLNMGITGINTVPVAVFLQVLLVSGSGRAGLRLMAEISVGFGSVFRDSWKKTFTSSKLEAIPFCFLSYLGKYRVHLRDPRNVQVGPSCFL